MVNGKLPARRFTRRTGMNGQRVHRTGQFLRQNLVHKAVTVDSAFAFEAI